MPPAKQTTISCSVCSRFHVAKVDTNSATGSTMEIKDGTPKRVIFRNTQALWPWCTIRSSALRLWLRTATPDRAAVARTVGPSNWLNRYLSISFIGGAKSALQAPPGRAIFYTSPSGQDNA